MRKIVILIVLLMLSILIAVKLSNGKVDAQFESPISTLSSPIYLPIIYKQSTGVYIE